MKVQDALVDAHLEAVPSVGSLSAGRLAGHDLQLLGGQAHGSRHLELLLDRALLKVRANCRRQHTARAQESGQNKQCTASSLRESGGVRENVTSRGLDVG